jgi:hypothetical protein
MVTSNIFNALAFTILPFMPSLVIFGTDVVKVDDAVQAQSKVGTAI